MRSPTLILQAFAEVSVPQVGVAVVALPLSEAFVPQVGFAAMALPLSRAPALAAEMGAPAEELQLAGQVGATVPFPLSTAAHSSREANPP